MSLQTTLRQLLTFHEFDWDNGVIVIPGERAENLFISDANPTLDNPFDLMGESQTSPPIFTAEDPVAMYFFCFTIDMAATFQKVPLANLDVLSLNGIRGYPHGADNEGVSLTFTDQLLEVCVTQGQYQPAIAGCAEVHLYCIASDKKEAMDLFTTRVLACYLKVASDLANGEEVQTGYLKLLERLFYKKLKVQVEPLSPLEKER